MTTKVAASGSASFSTSSTRSSRVSHSSAARPVSGGTPSRSASMPDATPGRHLGLLDQLAGAARCGPPRRPGGRGVLRGAHPRVLAVLGSGSTDRSPPPPIPPIPRLSSSAMNPCCAGCRRSFNISALSAPQARSRASSPYLGLPPQMPEHPQPDRVAQRPQLPWAGVIRGRIHASILRPRRKLSRPVCTVRYRPHRHPSSSREQPLRRQAAPYGRTHEL